MTKRISHSYFVVMVDHGKRGLEAVVHPEDTRREVVQQLASGESKHVCFIHHVDGLLIMDVTNDLFDEAERLVRAEHSDHDANRLARALFDGDHERDLRKHETV